MKTKKQKGFTLVELVIVIAVIAILAAVLIPTFSNLVKKANLSADEQAVKQMNTALAIYTAENGKPETAGEVKAGLSENEINVDTMEPVTQGYAFYWDNENNKIVLVGEGKASAKEGWALLTSTGYGKLEEVSNSEGIKQAINKATNNDPVLIKLKDNVTISEKLVIKDNKTVIFDLNNKNLNFTYNSNITSSGDPAITIQKGNTLNIKNGSIKSNFLYTLVASGSLSINNVTIEASASSNDGAALYVSGIVDVSIVHSTIINNSFHAISSNTSADEADGARISIVDNSLIKSVGYAGIYLGTYVDLIIEDSEICGDAQGIYLRGCNATIKNSKIYNTVEDKLGTLTTWYGGARGAFADIVFAAGGSGYVSTGNYTCENVTGNPDTSASNPEFTVVVHEPQNAKVNINGVTDYKKFTGDNPQNETWN